MPNPIRTEPHEWPPFRTLADLALRHWNIRIRCDYCAHEGVIGCAQLWWKFYRKRWDDHLSEVEKRLRCSSCYFQAHTRGSPKIIGKTRDVPTWKVPLPNPDIGEWKRLVSRSRG